jgi:hypothetical protein
VRAVVAQTGVLAGKTRRALDSTVELKRANEIPKRAASFFGAELDRQHKK